MPEACVRALDVHHGRLRVRGAVSGQGVAPR